MAYAEWQQIETAPRDGTWVLLTGGKASGIWGGDEPPCVVGQYVLGEWHFAWDESGHLGCYHWPTHWMPLPAPPAQSIGEGGE